MSREITISATRCAVVWLGVSASCAWGLSRSARVLGPAGSATADTTFADLFVQASAVAFTAALVWLWAVTTATVVTLLRGQAPRRPGRTRRIVLLLCGAAIAAGVATPAAAQGDPASALTGLSLPDRASVPAPAGPEPRPRDHHVVAAGDSLWSIARSTSQPGSDLGALSQRIWQANRALVGDDPDLILPGQRLRLPHRADDQSGDHDRPEGGE